MNNCSYNFNCEGKANIMKIPQEEIIDEMEDLLNIASDSTRIKILWCLLGEDESENVEKTVSEIVSDVEASQSLISHQLKVLKDARLVKPRKEGKNVFYSLNDKHIRLLLNVVYEHVTEEDSEE